MTKSGAICYVRDEKEAARGGVSSDLKWRKAESLRTRRKVRV